MSILSRRMSLFRCLITVAVIGFTLAAADRLAASPFEEKEPTGFVWFFGTVEQVVDGIPLIDLGEVHTLRRGNVVAAVRYRDSHFSPLGLLEIDFSNPTWCQARKPMDFQVVVGDMVMFVETPGDLGSGERLQDSFLRHRIVANSNRNRYSTMRSPIEADTMQRLIEKQPGWVEGDRRVSGTIRSNSVTRDMGKKLVPFINQVMLFHDYQDRGIDLNQATPKNWVEVLGALRGKANEAAEEPVVEIAQGDATDDPDAQAAAAIAVRRFVDDSLFERSPEERNLIAAICVALLRTKTSNDSQWVSQQFARSQFPAFSNQDQILIDIEAIMRKVRKLLD